MKYIRITRRVFGMLGLRFREGALLIGFLVLYASLEGFGITLLLPILEYLETGGESLPQGGVWPILTRLSGALGVPLTLGTLLVVAFVPIVLRQGVYFTSVWYTAIVQNRAIEQLITRTFRAIVTAQVSYVDGEDQGALIGLITGQVARCGQALVQFLRLLSAAMVLLAYAILLLALSWQLALIAIVAMVLVSWGVRRTLIATRAHGADVTRASVELTAAVRERLAAIRLLKMRAQEEAEAQVIATLAARLRRAGTKIAVAAARVEVIVDPALMLAVFGIVYVGVVYFNLTLAGLGLFMFILLRLNAKAKELNVGRQTLASLMPAFDYVERSLAEADAMRTPEGGALPFEGLRDDVTFRQVTFSYGDSGESVLKGVDLTIPKGTMTAIVGRSGAGKSTLVDMIPLLRLPDTGEVLFDGVPGGMFDLALLRRRIGLLTQEPILFNDTIRSNLVYGLDQMPDDDQIHGALDASYCSDFVSALPEGIETRLGDRGVRFSGGQRQRLALARVLLQEPDILILDEPTSALDSESEQYIQNALTALHGSTTLVVIAHRLATVENADQIAILDGGTIAELGTHAELMSRTDGAYRRLFDMQIRA